MFQLVDVVRGEVCSIGYSLVLSYPAKSLTAENGLVHRPYNALLPCSLGDIPAIGVLCSRAMVL